MFVLRFATIPTRYISTTVRPAKSSNNKLPAPFFFKIPPKKPIHPSRVTQLPPSAHVKMGSTSSYNPRNFLPPHIFL